MKLNDLAFASLSCVLAGTSAHAAPAQQACAALDALLHQAETDFVSLRQKKLQPGKCSFRSNEFKCEWAFPSDAFAVAEAQSAQLAQCVAQRRAYKQVSAKRGETAFLLEPDLSVVVGHPEGDLGDWKVKLRIVSSAGSN